MTDAFSLEGPWMSRKHSKEDFSSFPKHFPIVHLGACFSPFEYSLFLPLFFSFFLPLCSIRRTVGNAFLDWSTALVHLKSLPLQTALLSFYSFLEMVISLSWWRKSCECGRKLLQEKEEKKMKKRNSEEKGMSLARKWEREKELTQMWKREKLNNVRFFPINMWLFLLLWSSSEWSKLWR